MSRSRSETKVPKTTPTAPTSETSLTTWLLRVAAIGIAIFSLLFLLSLSALAWKGAQAWRMFSQEAGVTWPGLKSQLETGLESTPLVTGAHKNVLILGVDTLAGRGDVPPLTDTMMLASLDFNSATVRTLPLPRDLWSDTYQTKINALYWYGQENNPDQPEAFTTQVVQEMTGVPIHHTVVVSLEQVAQVIDMLGGITVDVQQPFSDSEFPRPGVDVTTEKDPQILYMTINFEAGAQKLSGERALQYIRSRHSQGEEGDDTARSRRQQQVIQAMVAQLLSPQTLTNPRLLGKLYAFYTQNFEKQLALTEILASVRALAAIEEQPAIESAQLGIYPEDPTGSITHPPVSSKYQNQWVYIVREPGLFQTEVQTDLGHL
jgi:anionic cell wall polymer biosynthesis LytR-Cps2A-Psr (LCP) family protein